MKLSAIYTIYNEEDYIAYSLSSIYSEVDEIVICLTTGKPWYGDTRVPDRTEEIIRTFDDPQKKITLITGEWPNEPSQRNEALERIREKADFCLIMDGDELYKTEQLQIIKVALQHNPGVGQVRVGMNTYWKSPLYRIDPPEPYMPVVITRVGPNTNFVDLRATNEEPMGTLPREVAIMYHFSYAKPSEKIKMKMENFSHADEIIPGWWDNIWLAWDHDRSLRELHPTHPWCYAGAVPEDPANLPAPMLTHPFVVDGVNGIAGTGRTGA